MPKAETESKCQCDVRTRVLDDGCRYCNPQECIDMLNSFIRDYEKEIDDQNILIQKLQKNRWSWQNKAKRHWSNWRKRGKIIEAMQKKECNV